MSWWNRQNYKKYDSIICDGSVRSGKTLAMSIGFVLWSMSSYNNQSFAFCGKTIESLRRNVITPLHKLLEGLFCITERVSKNYVEISANGVTNRYYLFGGRDESSYALVQGITLAGVLLDEVALMPRSFVEQTLARCSVNGSKLWFNCNPESPQHWFLKEWIEKSEEKNALHLHFTMEDNLSLTADTKRRYENLYSEGVFYERYILGLWKKAEGLVYPMFDEKIHVLAKDSDDTNGKTDKPRYYISIDYGTVNPCSMGLWAVYKDKAIRIDEYYHDARKLKRQKTDEEYYAALEKLAGDKIIERVIVDPSAASFKETIRRHGRFLVRDAVNDVIDGIRIVSQFLQGKKILFSDKCKSSIGEFGMYSWDEKNGGDKVLKENDHAMDDIRYFCNTILNREYRWTDWS